MNWKCFKLFSLRGTERGNVALSVGLTEISTFLDLLDTFMVPQRMNHTDSGDPLAFSSCTTQPTIRGTMCREMSRQLWDGLPWERHSWFPEDDWRWSCDFSSKPHRADCVTVDYYLVFQQICVHLFDSFKKKICIMMNLTSSGFGLVGRAIWRNCDGLWDIGMWILRD